MTKPLKVSHRSALLQSFSFVRHAIQRFDSLAAARSASRPARLCRVFPNRSILDFARNDKMQVREPWSDEAVQCPSSWRVALESCVLLAFEGGEINHEEHEGHEEFDRGEWRSS